MTERRLEQPFEFITFVDRLKQVERRTSPIGLERRENSAEHSWHIILMAVVLAEHSNKPVDLLKVVKMLAIHDLVEVEVGDTFHYAKSIDASLSAKESAAAERIFGMLPSDQSDEFKAIWEEFEDGSTSEAKFANAVDRCAAFVLNRGNDFGTWKQHSISPDQIRVKNNHAADGSSAVWSFMEEVIAEWESK